MREVESVEFSRFVSIHAPRTGRDVSPINTPVFEKNVSIHAPRTGRDSRGDGGVCIGQCFNPRAPNGARLKKNQGDQMPRVFQSTRPERGATIALPGTWGLLRVSIHAPRTGRDALWDPDHRIPHRFQSTRPERGATVRASSLFSQAVVSIHAPRTGRDLSRPFKGRLQACFNPRAPNGARLRWVITGTCTWMFQSTRPERGATLNTQKTGKPNMVSIHAPRTGRDK